VEKEKKPKRDWPFIGHFEEEYGGKIFVIAVRGDPKAIKKLPKADEKSLP
jgi:hypothetical protein